jgi:phosphopantetheinyl transferase
VKIFSLADIKNLTLDELPHVEDIVCFVLESADSSGLKKELSRLVGNSSQQFLKGRDGKPSFADSSYQFNLSHSGDYTAVAIHRSMELGIDIETWKPKKRMEPIAHRYFSKEENAVLDNLSDENWESKALSFWTVKEAMIKLNGGTLFEGISLVNAVPLPREIKLQFELRGIYSLSLAKKTH